jgi:diamine N-acetyltransferase
LAYALREAVVDAARRLIWLPEAQTTLPGDGETWSAREILGHLIDSAANNHARFVRAQLTTDLAFPGYDQEAWVRVQRYAETSDPQISFPWQELIGLWRAYNLHLAHVIAGIPEAVLDAPRSPHTLDRIAWEPVPADGPATLDYLIRDYVGHLQAHVQQIYAVMGLSAAEPRPDLDAAVSLREVTADTVRAICNLEVAPWQERYVAPNTRSIAQAHFAPDLAWFRAIYADETPVGFLMLSDEPDEPRYFLWRFMIDARYQRHGYGRQALELLVAHVRTRPGARELLVSCVPGEGSPCPFYERFGFVYTGANEHRELVMRLPL